MRIEIGNKEIARLGAGSFVGEMTYLTGDAARAGVTGVGKSEIFCWEKQQLEQWLHKDPSRQARMQSALGSQVVELLMQKSSAESGT